MALIEEPIMILTILVLILMIGPAINKKTHISEIIVFIFIGFLISPNFLNLINFDEIILLFQEIGLLFVMFTLGLQVELDKLETVKRKLVLFGSLAFIISYCTAFFFTFIIFYLIPALTIEIPQILFIAFILSSHSIVELPIENDEAYIYDNEAVQYPIGGSLVSNIILFIVITLNTNNFRFENTSSLDFLPFIINGLIFFLFGLIILPKIVSYLFSKTTESLTLPQTRFIFILFLLFALSFTAYLINLEPIIGAYIAGIGIKKYLKGDNQTSQKLDFIANYFFIPIFFIYLGMMVDYSFINHGNFSGYKSILFLCVMIISLFFSKYISAIIATKLFKLTNPQKKLIFAMLLPQVGISTAIIIIGVNNSILDPSMINFGVVILVISILISQTLVKRVINEIKDESKEILKETPIKFEKILLDIKTKNSIKNLYSLSNIIIQKPNSIGVENKKYLICSFYVSKFFDREIILTEDMNLEQERVLREDLLKYSIKISKKLKIDAILENKRQIHRNHVSALFEKSLEIKPNLILLNRDPIGETIKTEKYFFSKHIDQMLRKTISPIGLLHLKMKIKNIQTICLILTNYDVEHKTNFKTIVYISKLIAQFRNEKVVIIDQSRFPEDIILKQIREVQISQSTFSTKFRKKVRFSYHYHKLFGKQDDKVNEYITKNDLVIASITPYHPLFSIMGYSEPGLYESNISPIMDQNSLILYFPEGKDLKTEKSKAEEKKAKFILENEEINLNIVEEPKKTEHLIEQLIGDNLEPLQENPQKIEIPEEQVKEIEGSSKDEKTSEDTEIVESIKENKILIVNSDEIKLREKTSNIVLTEPIIPTEEKIIEENPLEEEFSSKIQPIINEIIPEFVKEPTIEETEIGDIDLTTPEKIDKFDDELRKIEEKIKRIESGQKKK